MPDGRRSLGGSGCGRAGLEHEGGDETVDGGEVVEGGGAKRQEVLRVISRVTRPWWDRAPQSLVPLRFLGRFRRRLRL